MNNNDYKNIFEKHYTSVYRLLAVFLRNRSAAEDLAQETFLKFYLTPPRESNNVGGWLMRVAKNLAFNHLQRERNRAGREACLELPKVTEPESTFLEKEENSLINRALQTLNERDKICLTLRLTGMSYAEIAQILDVKETSVGTMLARARERFKAEYLNLKGGDQDVL